LHEIALPCRVPIRVLVVDDEPQICELVSRILAHAGCWSRPLTPERPRSTRSRATASLIPGHRSSAVDGDELVARLRHSTLDLGPLPTGYSQSLFDTRSVLWEGEAFLEKPCSPAALLEGVSLLLFDRTAPSVPGLPRQAAVLRSMLAGLARNPGRGVQN
jgi:CheY-like chemotaxis protein